MGIGLNSNYWKNVVYSFLYLHTSLIGSLAASISLDNLPLFVEKSLLSIRSEYAKPVMHEIPYEKFPGASLRFKVERLNPDAPDNSKPGPLCYQEGALYYYGNRKVGGMSDGAYYQARLTYAKILLGMNSKHPWCKYIGHKPETALSILIGLIKQKPCKATARRVARKIAIEDLRYLEGCYSTTMHIASSIDLVDSYDGLVQSIDNSFKNIMSSLNLMPLKDFILRIWKDRQAYLKTNLDKICEKSQLTKQEIIDAIIDRKVQFKLNGTDLYLLLLRNSTRSFYPLEAVLFKANNSELFHESMK